MNVNTNLVPSIGWVAIEKCTKNNFDKLKSTDDASHRRQRSTCLGIVHKVFFYRSLYHLLMYMIFCCAIYGR